MASIIFAIMAVMAYGGLDNVLQNSQASKQALKRLQQIQQCIAVLDRDLTQIMPRPIRDEFGNTRPYLIASETGDHLLEFTRGGRVNPANIRRSSMLRIAYRFDENELIRLQWPQLDRAQGTEPRETSIIDKLEEITFRFLDSNGVWQDQWPPLNPSTNTSITTNTGNANQESNKRNANRPTALEVVLRLEDWGEIRRLYSLN